MKTAVSLPDDLFASADDFAARNAMNRSELYAEALREYLARHDTDQVTAALDALARDVDSALPADAARAVRALHLREAW
jgi:metal-responsive CopG/Arc/MetJ family transcriptional regulator